jgi:hypothetical protein
MSSPYGAAGGQATYDRTFGGPYAGTVGDATDAAVFESWLNDNGSQIPVGVGLVDSGNAPAANSPVTLAAAPKAALPSGATQPLVGIAMLSYARDPGSQAIALTDTQADSTQHNAIFQGQEVNVLSKGRAWVVVDGATSSIVPSTSKSVYVRYTDNGAGKHVLGAFANAAGTGLRFCGGARWLTGIVATDTADGPKNLAMLEFDASVDFGLLVTS